MTKANFVSGLSSGGGASDEVVDADNDTKIQVDKDDADDDTIRFDIAGTEMFTLTNMFNAVNGTFYNHNQTLASSNSYTIPSGKGTVVAGAIDVQGTLDVVGDLVVL